ncbi:MAG: hypothetical protein KGQ59_09670, partial [Bdellovibrionales bacterium]|nr:hypothetical protein [Bdellovibrionales bacterium]
MIQISKRIYAALALSAVIVAPQAFAMPGMDIGVMGGGSFAKSSQSGLDSKFGISGGASVGLGPLEVSALYTQYKFSQPGTDYTLNYLDVPVLYRLSLGPVSVGAGGFYSAFLSGSNN